MAYTNPLSLPYTYEVVETNEHMENRWVGLMTMFAISKIYALQMEAENRIARECREDGNSCTLYINNFGRCHNLHRNMDRVVITRSGFIPTDGVDA